MGVPGEITDGGRDLSTLSRRPLAVVLTVLVWRRHTLEPPRPDRDAAPTLDDITLPDNASRGRRRGHLWPTDGNAA